MVGAPSICTFWIYNYLYPLEMWIDDQAPQHYFLLAICLWFNTIGPSENLIARCFSKKEPK